jgi:Proprotein convertase P-domain
VSAGQAPFTGSFRPEGALSAFDGKNARGTWTLWVEDRATGDRGVLHYFSLLIEERVSGNGATVTAAEETEATPSVETTSDAPSQTAASEQATSASAVVHTMKSEATNFDYFNLPGRESAPSGSGQAVSAVWMSGRVVSSADTARETHLVQTAVDLVFAAVRGKRDARTPLFEASALSADELLASFEANELTALTNTPS